MDTNNPGKTVTIYDNPGIVKLALPKAINPTNIISRFQATGIASFNRDIFTNADFLSSSDTDREMTSQNNAVETAQLGQAALKTYSHRSTKLNPFLLQFSLLSKQ